MDRALTSARTLWERFTFTRYLGASVVALGFDTSCFWLLVVAGMDATLASGIGYSLGIIIHWLVSANIVFPGKTREGAALLLQRALFAGSALMGLAITVAIVALMSAAGFHAIAAKGVAVGVSFFAVYAARKWGVFR
ncbi:GtrA family protein [Sphingorhabdus sp.]|jgi:putative flippase GtrA|uniref:GtrA family protein n=1 Tax=Sphingorhabdus sp. TaxID=1902408 RepID=UPI003BB1BB6C|nr:GtrA family protein [Sphingomonadales bacterium]MBK9431473.1 GtrA family protein [Sphingomonadales bacterium]MBL0023114.1 GtrA family protein [Sphingomonadales bacterium]